MNVEERLKQLIEYVKCPETGSKHFGEWGILTRSQRLFLDKLARDTLALLSAMDEKIRKIPENAVVLTGTETEERLEDLLIEFDEMSFYPATLMPNAEECAMEWKRKLIYAIGQLRKETAEKFAERVKMAFYYEFDEIIPSIMADKIDEICKEITESK